MNRGMEIKPDVLFTRQKVMDYFIRPNAWKYGFWGLNGFLLTMQDMSPYAISDCVALGETHPERYR